MKKITTRILTLLVMVSVCTSPVLAASMPSAENTAKTEPAPASVTSAVDEFKSLSRNERKSRIKEAKKLMKEYKADKRAGRAEETDQVLLAILAILLPPLAVYLKEGEVNSKFWISIILTLLFWIPGVIFALLVVFDAI
ncbi:MULTISPECIES: YqaE/Pmp3 family membrane protein [Niastella]|uniref:YqaE/Pmp3 family membrane protein n=1 Tax=Niastella soli TaxID=2821487 RepID=A0ABS3YZS9_9BACT|nr:YqaE/Pmp3 family membrane protein [Niastella soli]MBO9203436.1 YqaE/Pmp3 family membrane protein [Niastella soli]